MTRPRRIGQPISTRGGSHRPIHDARLAQLVERHGLRRGGFFREVERVVRPELEAADLIDEPADLLAKLRCFLPDAYRINVEAREVECWEVCLGSPPVIYPYLDGLYALEEADWHLRLFYIDGRTGAGHEINIPITAYFQNAERIVEGSYVTLPCDDYDLSPWSLTTSFGAQLEAECAERVPSAPGGRL